eukprot:CAMPEP_0184377956 /NCGR_PEP_ID=MMETSP0007-20130409/2688_1 /TAXON_ID=97485 /ORGANISM="Prymnesium parvum, Strain Texoma1" /LENGTH=96 /DNA_ID=CAMNT_0026722039 /DNA_START=167 /DNA_END=453 /DNA_ORIENTATION=+
MFMRIELLTGLGEQLAAPRDSLAWNLFRNALYQRNPTPVTLKSWRASIDVESDQPSTSYNMDQQFNLQRGFTRETASSLAAVCLLQMLQCGLSCAG